METYNYYSWGQFEHMHKLDPIAKCRPQELEGISSLICTDCGAIEYFRFRIKMQYKIMNENGNWSFVPIGDVADRLKMGMSINRIRFMDHLWEHGETLDFVCDHCAGPAVDTFEVEEHCAEKDCAGCLLCGVVTSLSDTEERIRSCTECYGGDRNCLGDNYSCPNYFMRIYHGLGTKAKNIESTEGNYDW